GVAIVRALDVASVGVVRRLGTHVMETQAGPIQVVACPWAVRSLVLGRQEYKNHTIAELNQALIDLTRDKLRLEIDELDPNLPTIVVGHAHLFGARIGAE